MKKMGRLGPVFLLGLSAIGLLAQSALRAQPSARRILFVTAMMSVCRRMGPPFCRMIPPAGSHLA